MGAGTRLHSRARGPCDHAEFQWGLSPYHVTCLGLCNENPCLVFFSDVCSTLLGLTLGTAEERPQGNYFQNIFCDPWGGTSDFTSHEAANSGARILCELGPKSTSHLWGKVLSSVNVSLVEEGFGSVYWVAVQERGLETG